MGADMFDLAKKMALAGMGLEAEEPLSGTTRRRLFERLYGHEFPEPHRSKIGRWLEGEGL